MYVSASTAPPITIRGDELESLISEELLVVKIVLKRTSRPSLSKICCIYWPSKITDEELWRRRIVWIYLSKLTTAGCDGLVMSLGFTVTRNPKSPWDGLQLGGGNEAGKKNHLVQWWNNWRRWVYYGAKPCSNSTDVPNFKFWIVALTCHCETSSFFMIFGRNKLCLSTPTQRKNWPKNILFFVRIKPLGKIKPK